MAIGLAFLHHFPTSSHFPPAPGTFHWPIRTPRFQRSKATWKFVMSTQRTEKKIRIAYEELDPIDGNLGGSLLGLSTVRIRIILR